MMLHWWHIVDLKREMVVVMFKIKNKGKCWNCGMKDHLRRDCILNPKTNPQASNNSGVNITEEGNSYEYAKVSSVVQ